MCCEWDCIWPVHIDDFRLRDKMNDEKKGILNVNALKKLEETKKMKVH